MTEAFTGPEWESFVRRFREDAVREIASSAIVATLAPDGDFDVKIACEIGATLLLDKPLIVIALPGRAIPAALRRAAVEVVECDIETEAGRDHLAERINALTGDAT